MLNYQIEEQIKHLKRIGSSQQNLDLRETGSQFSSGHEEYARTQQSFTEPERPLPPATAGREARPLERRHGGQTGVQQKIKQKLSKYC